MAPIISKVLQECHGELEEGLYSTRLLIHLYSKNCINAEDKDEIESCKTFYGKSRKLLAVLSKKSDSVLDVILQYLHEDGTQKHLEELIYEFCIANGYYGESGGEVTSSKRRKIQILPQKWWPEHKELITSFVDRRGPDGQLLVEHLRQLLVSTTSSSNSEFKRVTAIISKKHALVGMGGIGKTSTAKWYANTYQEEYDQIIWIDSEGQSLNNSFVALGKKLGLDDVIASNTSTTLKELTRTIYEKFTNLRCLFVFDNAERFDGENGLQDFLPRADSFHAIITSRNHDWGHPSEFGKIPTFQLDVFTNEECVALLTRGLHEKLRDDETDIMLALGEQLGFLPLALQCAVVTIMKSKHYTLTTYLERLQQDMKILVDRRILTEYERPVSATLHLSIEQIEKDEEIENECRDWCKVILNVAAYCEPHDIPEALFLGLPDANKCMLRDAVDQLLQYSLVSAESFTVGDVTERVFGIHRLLQHVIRHKVLVDSDCAIRAIKLAFRCMNRDLEVFYRHGMCAWNLAAAQFDEILRDCHEFPLEVSKKDTTMTEFILSSLQSLQRIFQPIDLPIVQLRLRLISNLIENNQIGEARAAYDDDLWLHVRLLEDQVPTKQPLLLPLEILNLDIRESGLAERREGEYEIQCEDAESEDKLNRFTQLVERMEETSYIGKINGISLYWHLQRIYKWLPFKLSVILNYAIMLSLSDQHDLAKETLLAELNMPPDTPLSLSAIFDVFERLQKSSADLLNSTIPNIYNLMKSRLLHQYGSIGTINESINVEEDQHDAIAGITDVYISWLHDSEAPLSEYLEILTFLNQLIKSKLSDFERTEFVKLFINAVIEILKLELSPTDMEELIESLSHAWNSLTNSIRSIEDAEKEDHMVKLFQLNMIYSYVLAKTTVNIAASVSESTKLDVDLIREFKMASGINWPLWHSINSNEYFTPTIADNISVCNYSAKDIEKILCSKLAIFMFIIQQSKEFKFDWSSLGSLMSIFDEACWAHARLQQNDKCLELWTEGIKFVLGYESFDVSLSLVLGLGASTLKLLQNQNQSEVLPKMMAQLPECVKIALKGDSKEYDLKKLIVMTVRLINCDLTSASLELAGSIINEANCPIEQQGKLNDFKELLDGMDQGCTTATAGETSTDDTAGPSDQPDKFTLIKVKLLKLIEELTSESEKDSNSDAEEQEGTSVSEYDESS